MKQRYRLDLAAVADMEGIYEYVSKDNRPAARRLIQSFRKTFVLLAQHPLMGELRPDVSPGIRIFSIRAYLICYRIVGDQVQIARVLHGARDIETAF